MAYQKIEMAMTVLLVTLSWWRAMAQSSGCTSVLISLSPCLSYIQGSSSTPSPGCCSQLASVVGSQPQCLCQVLNGGGSSLGISINRTQALQLPKACNVQTPPVSLCNVASSAESPAESPTKSPVSPSTLPSGKGSNVVPSTDSKSSDASSVKMAAPLMFFLLFVASYVSAFVSSSRVLYSQLT